MNGKLTTNENPLYLKSLTIYFIAALFTAPAAHLQCQLPVGFSVVPQTM